MMSFHHILVIFLSLQAQLHHIAVKDTSWLTCTLHLKSIKLHTHLNRESASTTVLLAAKTCLPQKGYRQTGRDRQIDRQRDSDGQTDRQGETKVGQKLCLCFGRPQDYQLNIKWILKWLLTWETHPIDKWVR